METTTNSNATPRTALIRRPEVSRLTALSRSSIYDLMRKNKFPKPVELGSNSVAWLEVEIHQWIAERIAAGRRGIAECKKILGGA